MDNVATFIERMVEWDRIACGSDPRKPHVPFTMSRRLYAYLLAQRPELRSEFERCTRCRAGGVPIVRV